MRLYTFENPVAETALRLVVAFVLAYWGSQSAGWNFWAAFAVVAAIALGVMALVHPAIRRRHQPSA